MSEDLTLSSGTGLPANYIGYKGMPMEDWNSLLNLERWFCGGLVDWIYLNVPPSKQLIKKGKDDE